MSQFGSDPLLRHWISLTLRLWWAVILSDSSMTTGSDVGPYTCRRNVSANCLTSTSAHSTRPVYRDFRSTMKLKR